MIAQLCGTLRAVLDEAVLVEVEPFVFELNVPEQSARVLRSRLGERVQFHTLLHIEGNQASGRLTPRMLGFLSAIDREFFEFLCSVDGVGVRKALRAMVRPVRDIACGIQDQDRSMLATLPGVGEALAERIIAKLRRKVGKFALAVESASGPSLEPGTEEAAAETHDAQILRETFAALLSVGHTESQARQLIDKATTSKRRYQSVADLIEAIYAAGQSR